VTAAEKDYRRRLVRRARRCNITLAPDVADRLSAYLELLAVWNRRINLTALDDPDAAVDRLILEPLLAAKHVPSTGSVIDIGSGGGSPAIPLKIVSPGIALREAVRQLQLDKVNVEVRRFEELLASPEMHESMDVVTVRAVRVQPSVLMGLQALLRVGGQILLFRGPGQPGTDRLPFPLVAESDEPLVEALRSRLLRLRRVPVDADQPLARG
jgi:16S rRNA (guanine527-N7)-methyltransferase